MEAGHHAFELHLPELRKESAEKPLLNDARSIGRHVLCLVRTYILWAENFAHFINEATLDVACLILDPGV